MQTTLIDANYVLNMQMTLIDMKTVEVICKLSVMHVKFTHRFILGRNLKIVLIPYPGRDPLFTAAEVTNVYQFITLLLRLNTAVT